MFSLRRVVTCPKKNIQPCCKYSCEPPKKPPPSTEKVRAGADVNAYKAIIEVIMKKCDTRPCANIEYPRFDDLYYRPSDKEREYQQTWCEPPEITYECEPICLEPLRFECIEPERRKLIRAKKGGLASNQCLAQEKNKVMMNLMSCRQMIASSDINCPRYPMPFCKPARNPPICYEIPESKPKKPCKKEPAPYPSFSECRADLLDVKRVSECFQAISMCEVWRSFVRKHDGTGNPDRPNPVKCKEAAGKDM